MYNKTVCRPPSTVIMAHIYHNVHSYLLLVTVPDDHNIMLLRQFITDSTSYKTVIVEKEGVDRLERCVVLLLVQVDDGFESIFQQDG